MASPFTSESPTRRTDDRDLVAIATNFSCSSYQPCLLSRPMGLDAGEVQYPVSCCFSIFEGVTKRCVSGFCSPGLFTSCFKSPTALNKLACILSCSSFRNLISSFFLIVTELSDCISLDSLMNQAFARGFPREDASPSISCMFCFSRWPPSFALAS